MNRHVGSARVVRITTALLLVLTAAGCRCQEPAPLTLPSGVYIAHGLGGLGNIRTSNSREAFEQNYAAG